MPIFAFAVPIPPGQTDDWLRFAAETQERAVEHAVSRQEAGITRELAFLQRGEDGDVAVLVLEAEDPQHALAALAAAESPYDAWLRDAAPTVVDPVLDWAAGGE
jgi:hypothetical protein